MVGVRVDRRSPIGNPYVLARPKTQDAAAEEREAVCDAYDDLLSLTLHPGRALSAEEVRYIGVRNGFGGTVAGWNCVSVRREMDRLRLLSDRCSVQLECHCHPLRCHAESIAVRLCKIRDKS